MRINDKTWRNLIALRVYLILLLCSPAALARTFALESDVVGEIVLTTTIRTDTIADIARTYSQGYREMRMANPNVDPWLTGDDTEVVIPSLYVLPEVPREGITINVPEMRLYYFLPATRGERRMVATYPISIGRQDWSTPHGVTRIVSKVKDPSWTPPESIRLEHAAEGDFLPKVVLPGPQNPLGKYALRLSLPGYLIHGTDKPYGIGMRVTHGCMRLYPQDIETVYHTVPVGTPVRLVNQPYKVGLAQGQVYLEVHPPLDEDAEKFRDQFSYVVTLVTQKFPQQNVNLNWPALRSAIYLADGVPRVVGTAVASNELTDHRNEH
ncbi:MAG: L,D-transpeptidase family protein [Gammaproteobacteria bacterium]